MIFFRALFQSTNLGWAVTRPEFQNCGHSMDYRAAQPQCGCGETPGWLTRLAPNTPPARGLQSVVPASELAEEQKALCGLSPQPTIGLCAAPAPGLPRWAEGMHGALSQATARDRRPLRCLPQWRRGTRRCPYPALPVPLSRCKISALWLGARLQSHFEEIRVPKKCRRRPGGVGRTWGCRGAHPEGRGRKRTPGPVAHETPQGLALLPPGLRLSGASSRPPQPRGSPSQAPRPLSSC